VRKRTTRLSLLLLLIASLSSALSAEETRPPAPSVVSLFPSRAAVFMEIPDLPAAAAACADSDLAALFRNPRVRNLLVWLRNSILLEDPDMLSFETLVSSFYGMAKGEMAAALYAPARFGRGSWLPHLVFAFRAGHTQGVLKEMEDLFSAAGLKPKRKLTPGGLPGGMDDYGSFFCFVLRDTVFVCSSEAAARSVLKAAATGDALDSSPLLAAAVSAGGRLFRAFLDLSADGLYPPALSELARCGGWKGLVFDLDLSGGLFSERLALLGGASSSPFSLLRPLSGDEWLDRVPASAAAFWRMRFDAPGLLAALPDLPGFRELYRNSLVTRFLRSFPGGFPAALSDILDGFAGACLFFPPQGYIPDYFVSLSLKPDKAKAAESCMDEALRLINEIKEADPPLFRSSVFKGRRMFQVLLRRFETLAPITGDAVLGLGVHPSGRSVEFTSGFMGMKAVISHPFPKRSVLRNEDFVALRNFRSGPLLAEGWVNLEEAARKLLPLLSSFLLPLSAQAARPAELPFFEELQPHLKGMAFRLEHEGEDLVLHDRATAAPLASVLALSITLALSSDALFPPPREERELSSRDRLPRLYALLNKYAASHDGRFPPSLDDVADEKNLSLFSSPETGSEIDPADVEGSSDYFYFRGLTVADAGMPLLANRLTLPGKRRWVLFTSGEVARVSDADLKELIAKYNEKTGRRVLLEDGMLFWF